MQLHAITLFFLSLWLQLSSALHESDAGVVDWHKSFVGVPNTDTKHTAPTFHEASQQSVLLTATSSNALAALNPLTGSVEWRYVFDPQDNVVTYQKQGSVVASLSGPGGANLRSFNVLNGEMLLEKSLHRPNTGFLIQPNSLGTYIAFGKQTREIYTLTNGRTVNLVNGSDISWTWTAEEQGSQVLYSALSVNEDALYLVGLEASFASYALHVVALSPTSGQVLSSSTLPSSISSGLDDFLVLPNAIVWLEDGVLKHFTLSPSLKGKVKSQKSASFKKLVDVGLSSHGFFMACQDDTTDQLMSITNGELGVTKKFNPSAQSLYTGQMGKDGQPYITCLSWSPNTQAASAEVHSLEPGALVTEYSLPFDTNTHGSIIHVAMDLLMDSRVRVFLTTTTGAVQIWEGSQHMWTREEGLSELNAVKFVELPERVSVLGEGLSEEGFVERLLRQVKDAKDLPGYIVHFIRRFATGSYESATSSAIVHPSSVSATQIPFRDAFGFRQVLVSSTAYGKVYGIDTGNGEILWSRTLGTGHERGTKIVPLADKMFVLKNVADVDASSPGTGPEIVLLADSVTEDSTVENVLLFHLNALTGQDVIQHSKSDGDLQGSSIASKPIDDAYILELEGHKIVVLIDSQFKVHLYPDNAETHRLFSAATASLSAPLRVTSAQGHRRLIGHQFDKKEIVDASDQEKFEYTAFPTWTFSFPEGHDVQAIVAPIRNPVASLGKVLGNRTTLYKYLNPHLLVVLTAPHSTTVLTPTAHCGLYLVDSVKGSIIYEASLPAEGNACNVKATFAENWLVYHYYDDEYQGSGQAKGYKMVTVELYEGKQVDEKTLSSSLSSYSDKMVEVTAYEQSFIYPHAVSAITLTSTKFGITSKDIIVANVNGKIQSISRRLLNPRRPIGRKPSSEEQEEQLIQYDPLLPDDPRKVISHNYDVARVRSITTSPALLESTSLVFAYGLDLFLTRVAPSNTFDVLNESFNKLQLVLTVMGLAAAIFVTRPMVRRKKLREKWYY
ncbi:DUF1620-domain-containing protein [Lentinula raphanica]|nr:DUF1620-domain-containing protein [Lentinula raphanica]